VNYDQGQQIIRLLVEIRDRLAPPPSQPPKAESGPLKSIFGYALGSGEYPTESQVRCAQAWLTAADQRGTWSVAEWDAVREILDVAGR
jgi:hypothetical protein